MGYYLNLEAPEAKNERNRFIPLDKLYGYRDASNFKSFEFLKSLNILSEEDLHLIKIGGYYAKKIRMSKEEFVTFYNAYLYDQYGDSTTIDDIEDVKELVEDDAVTFIDVFWI